MSDWQRTTRVCSTIALRPDHLAAIRAYIERHELEGAEAQTLLCYETVSLRRGKAGLLMRAMGLGNKSLVQSVILTPTRVVFALQRDQDPPGVTSALLTGLEVSDYEKSLEYSLMPDSGLQVHGIVAQGGSIGSLFFGLGEGPDADRARAVFGKAVKAAHGEGPPAGEGKVETDQASPAVVVE